MLGKLTEQTIDMVQLGKLTQETQEMVKQLGMTPEVGHQGYWIRPTPKQFRDSGEWTLEIHIRRDHGSELREVLCTARNTFKTRDEAVARGIQFGRDVIDGDVLGCSVAAL